MDLSVDDMPVRGEHPAVDLVNTVFIRGGLRGRLVDVLRTPADLAAWVDGQPLGGRSPGDGTGVFPAADDARGRAALAGFLDLREILRRLFAAATADEDAEPADVAALNALVRTSTDWVELPPAGRGPGLPRTDAADPPTAVRARVARAAVDLLTAPGPSPLRACPAPGCVLFYLRTHPRREWCSPGCGTRVRVARHSQRRDA
ncbi:CGNR zinc finger domain-containing protein [Nocardiopsis protaetiae]|uniref:CGNR zinc finger domain-containing protein n=1 Tax=Nocardiopsis protaetiae TaxID=3382270 RepID=UPI00387AF278